MKIRYTFLKYIANVAFLGLIGVVGISWIIALLMNWNYFPLSIIAMIIYTYVALVTGVIVPLVSGICVSLVVTLFFRTPNPASPIFQIMVILIALFVSFHLSYMIWDIILTLTSYKPMYTERSFILLHIIPITLVFVFSHYRALPHMFRTVQKRKEKQI